MFHFEKLNKYGIFCNDAVAKKLMPTLVETSIVMEAENGIVGIIAGVITSHIVNNMPLFQEVFWYVEEQYRVHSVNLLEELEPFCAKKGCKQIVMAYHGEERSAVADRLYRKQGYKILETHYIKTI